MMDLIVSNPTFLDNETVLSEDPLSNSSSLGTTGTSGGDDGLSDDLRIAKRTRFDSPALDPTAPAADSSTLLLTEANLRSQMELILRERQWLEREKQSFYKERDEFIRNSPALKFWQMTGTPPPMTPLLPAITDPKNGIGEFSLTSPRSSFSRTDSVLSILSDVVHLNVGGEHITTLRSTLTKFPDTMLSVMFGGKFNNSVDDQGRVFLDRSPSIFKLILEWLRTDHCPNLSKEQLTSFMVELDYFGLTDYFSQSFAELFTPDLKVFSLIVQPKCDEGRPGNTVGDVQSESFVFGACARGSPEAVIEIWFTEAVLISGISVAAFFFTPWDSKCGAGASIEFHDGREWRVVGSLPETFGQKQELHRVEWKPKFSFRWRLRHDYAIGISRISFH